MTLLIPAIDIGPSDGSQAPPAAVPAQRPASEPAAPAQPAQPDLLAATAAAQQALTGGNDRDAVVWLSEHIATLDRVVYPAAARHLHATADLARQQAATHRMALLLRRLHAKLAGDGAAPFEDVPTLRAAVLVALREHSAAERHLLDRLRERLTAGQWSHLTARYVERLQHGQTRPHPHMPRGGAAGRLAYRFTAWTDHVLDVLDSRTVRPIPAPRSAAA